ncbi:MAG: hypothetical protein WCQ57_16595 [Verrucomicrobiota bacterium]
MKTSLPAPRILKLAYLALALAIPAGSTSALELAPGDWTDLRLNPYP